MKTDPYEVVNLCLCDECVKRLKKIFNDHLKPKDWSEIAGNPCRGKKCFLCKKVIHEARHFLDIGF